MRLASRPHGMPTPANFTLAQTELAPLLEEALEAALSVLRVHGAGAKASDLPGEDCPVEQFSDN